MCAAQTSHSALAVLSTGPILPSLGRRVCTPSSAWSLTLGGQTCPIPRAQDLPLGTARAQSPPLEPLSRAQPGHRQTSLVTPVDPAEAHLHRSVPERGREKQSLSLSSGAGAPWRSLEGRLPPVGLPFKNSAEVSQCFRKHQVLGKAQGGAPSPCALLLGTLDGAPAHPATVDAGPAVPEAPPAQVTAPEPSASPGVWSCPCRALCVPRIIRAVTPGAAWRPPACRPVRPHPAGTRRTGFCEDQARRWPLVLISSHLSSCLAHPSVRQLRPWAYRGGCGSLG